MNHNTGNIPFFANSQGSLDPSSCGIVGMQILPDVAVKYPQLKDHIQHMNTYEQTHGPFWDGGILSNMTLIDAMPNKVVWEFRIEKRHCNHMGKMHGGCMVTILDIASSFALLTYTGRSHWKSLGVSTDINANYMRGMNAGQTARFECRVQRCGRNMANLYTEVLDEGGRVCYAGSHTKFSTNPKL